MGLSRLNPARYFYVRYGIKPLIAGIFIFVVTLSLAVVFFWPEGSDADPIPQDIKQRVSFDLYYPSRVPDGFYFDDIAYDAETGVATYNYAAPGGRDIFFSLQKKPEDFNLSEFYQQNMTGASPIEISLGEAASGVLQEQSVSTALINDTWIIISAGKDVTLDDLVKASRFLKKSEQQR